MALRSACGWVAVALLTFLVFIAPERVQAAAAFGKKPPALSSFAAPAAFRGRFARRVGYNRKHFWTRNLHGRRNGIARRYGWRHRGQATVSARVNPPPAPPRLPRRPGGPGNWVWGGNLWNIPAYPPPPSITPDPGGTIYGAGGNRPPIAPRFTHAPGQSAAQAAAALLDNKRHRAKELLIEVRADIQDSVKQDFSREYGVEVEDIGVIGLAGVRVWRLTVAAGQNRNLRELLTALLLDERVITAQPNYIYAPVQGAAEEKRTSLQEEGALSQKPPKQPLAGAGVKLAIIDTCVERDHAELQDSVVSSFDAIQQDSASCKPENHGTAVASLIGGHVKLHGTAEGAALLSARAFTFTSEENAIAATSREIALSMDWAAKAGAQAMNLSFAGPADPLIERVVAGAYRKGIALVAAAGNGGPGSEPLYPAAYPEVIAVTATDGKREIYSAANRGKYISVSARGVDVLVAHVNNTYALESGTSFAAAEVSGVVASLLEKRPKAGPEEIRNALQRTAAAVPGVDRTEAGYGLVNPAAAVAFVEASLPQ